VNKKLAVLTAVGFASGLPYLLVGSTLSAWLTHAGVDLTSVGLLSLVTVPYSIKVFWAPLCDRFAPRGARRRGWMVPAQLGVAGALWALGGVDLLREPSRVAILALACAFLSATNDIVTDAYQTDLLLPEERGPGASAAVLGYRTAMLVGGGLALGLADRVRFAVVYRALAGLMLLGVVATLLSPEPPEAERPASLRDSILLPLRAFFARPSAWATLAFLFCYRLGDTLVSTMAPPFLLSLGFSATEIGAVNQALGIGATIVGSVAGGAVVARLGLYRSLFVFCVLAAGTNLGYALLGRAGANHAGLVAVVAVDNLCGGLAVAASVVLVMTLCDRRFSATQYALLTSVAGVGGRLLGGGSGWLASRVGWPLYFAATLLPSLPALLLLGRLKGALTPSPTPAPPAAD
jgi:MFS transporter, PAT family, beta-lactamase induction signal transducer AmpG